MVLEELYTHLQNITVRSMSLTLLTNQFKIDQIP